jgi:hypothetical protein
MKQTTKHCFSFNGHDNGGEQLTLTTTLHVDENKHVTTEQEMTLQSYCNSASFNLIGAQLTPIDLRNLADELENEISNLTKSDLESEQVPYLSAVYDGDNTFYVVSYSTGHDEDLERELLSKTFTSKSDAKSYVKAHKKEFLDLKIHAVKFNF